jgi:hypothetical protein
MTASQTNATSGLERGVAGLQQRLDAALSEKAVLAGELAARTAELLERKSAFDERIEQQSATLDVLKAISASPGDAQPVHLRVHVGHRNPTGYAASFPRRVNSETTMGRAILSRSAVITTDSLTDPISRCNRCLAPLRFPISQCRCFVRGCRSAP